MQYKDEKLSTDVLNLPDSKMVKILVALCIVAAVQVCSAYHVAVPVLKQPYGFGEPRIINGQPAAPGQFPHQAGVTLDSRSFCGGSLISKNWVLTAGHCIEGFRSWSVVLGAHKLQNTNENGRVTVTSNKGIRHENYDEETISNDVGLISLPKDVQLTETVNIIKLPPKSYQNLDFTGRTVFVSGWGRTSDETTELSPTLQYVDLTVILPEECKAIFGEELITKTKYCCTGLYGKSPCSGDSGSSLSIGSTGNLTNLGIVSFGSSRGCAKGYPAGFTATPHFVDWISKKTGIPVSDV